MKDLKARIDVIEEGYELLLAYAAQGLTDDAASKAGAQVRDYLSRYEAALAVLRRDAEASRAFVRLVAAQPAVSSQLIDNLNASIHLRALLTDVFVLGELVGV